MTNWTYYILSIYRHQVTKYLLRIWILPSAHGRPVRWGVGWCSTVGRCRCFPRGRRAEADRSLTVRRTANGSTGSHARSPPDSTSALFRIQRQVWACPGRRSATVTRSGLSRLSPGESHHGLVGISCSGIHGGSGGHTEAALGLLLDLKCPFKLM